jgi:hypothetical protein
MYIKSNLFVKSRSLKKRRKYQVHPQPAGGGEPGLRPSLTRDRRRGAADEEPPTRTADENRRRGTADEGPPTRDSRRRIVAEGQLPKDSR